MRMNGSSQPLRVFVAYVAAALVPFAADGQTTAPPATQPVAPPATPPSTQTAAPPATQSVAPATAPAAPPQSFEALAWLRGCWEGKAR